MVEEEWALWRGKGDEYTIGRDRLYNFTSVAENLGLTPMLVWAVYAAKHFYAVLAYAKTGKEGAEGIESRLADLSVYAKLGRLIARMEKPDPPTTAAPAIALLPPEIDPHVKRKPEDFSAVRKLLEAEKLRIKDQPRVQQTAWEPWRKADG